MLSKNINTPTQHAHYIAKTSKVQKNKFIQTKQGTQACYVKIIDQPQLHIHDV